MGWMNDSKAGKGAIWGDEPQDLVGNQIRKLITPAEKKAGKLSVSRKRAIQNKLMKSKDLRDKFNKIYLREWGRKAMVCELSSHIKSGLVIY